MNRALLVEAAARRATPLCVTDLDAVIEGGELRLSRRRETLEDVVARDV